MSKAQENTELPVPEYDPEKHNQVVKTFWDAFGGKHVLYWDYSDAYNPKRCSQQIIRSSPEVDQVTHIPFIHVGLGYKMRVFNVPEDSKDKYIDRKDFPEAFEGYLVSSELPSPIPPTSPSVLR